jgi:hypothetical protein
VVGGGVFFIWGGAIAFMTSAHATLADAFFVLGAVLFIVKFASWEDARSHEKGLLITVFASVIAVVLTVGAVWGNHHLNKAPASPLPLEALSFDAYASNITYPKGTKVGDIEWMDGYIDVRLSIENNSDSLIQNLNLTIAVLDDGGVLLDMGQMGSNIPGVEFHAPELPEMSVRVRGADGQDSIITSRDMVALGSNGKKTPSLGKEYSLFCPRLFPNKGLLRLVLATGSNKGELTKVLRIAGTYETMPSTGSKLVTIDKTIHVRH